MKRHTGVHFYINIVNFDEIVIDEEAKTSQVNHAIHALDTFFSSVENYGKRVSRDTLTVEKITGSRLHMYVIGGVADGYDIVRKISTFSFLTAQFINSKIPKYRSLQDFSVQIGAAYGRFYDFEFSSENNYRELTTIGYAANYAAKLQGLAAPSAISISEDIFNALSASEQVRYQRKYNPSIEKYDQTCFYETSLSHLAAGFELQKGEQTDIVERANRLNLSDISFSDAHKSINYANISTRECKRLHGIPLFSDVRDFTSQFAEDDSNLEEMARKTESILTKMYETTAKCGGIHIQFQGDREFSLFQDIPSGSSNSTQKARPLCYKNAVVAALRMVDSVKPYSAHIGVGGDYGKLFATKVGARGEKDNLLLGKTVITADHIEDEFAGKDQVAISKEVYQGLMEADSALCKSFTPYKNVYITTLTYSEYVLKSQTEQLQSNTKKNNYNGAWGEE